MGANVLVGVQVPQDEEEHFTACANALGYEFRDEGLNKAFQLIMQ